MLLLCSCSSCAHAPLVLPSCLCFPNPNLRSLFKVMFTSFLSTVLRVIQSMSIFKEYDYIYEI